MFSFLALINNSFIQLNLFLIAKHINNHNNYQNNCQNNIIKTINILRFLFGFYS